MSGAREASAAMSEADLFGVYWRGEAALMSSFDFHQLTSVAAYLEPQPTASSRRLKRELMQLTAEHLMSLESATLFSVEEAVFFNCFFR